MDRITISKPLRKPSSWGMLFKGKIGKDSVILKVMHADPRDKFDYHQASFGEGCVKGQNRKRTGVYRNCFYTWHRSDILRRRCMGPLII